MAAGAISVEQRAPNNTPDVSSTVAAGTVSFEQHAKHEVGSKRDSKRDQLQCCHQRLQTTSRTGQLLE